MYNIDLLRDCSQAYNTVNSVLNAGHSVLTALIVCWAFAFAGVEVELVLLMLESIGPFAVILVAVLMTAADALNQDVHTVQLADNMMCLAYTGDKRLDRPLAYSSWIDMVANSTYHVDADHMRNTTADMWDSAFGVAAVDNGLVSVIPAALATVAEVRLALTPEVVDIGTYVKILLCGTNQSIRELMKLNR